MRRDSQEASLRSDIVHLQRELSALKKTLSALQQMAEELAVLKKREKERRRLLREAVEKYSHLMKPGELEAFCVY